MKQATIQLIFFVLFLQSILAQAQMISIDGAYMATRYQNLTPFNESKGGFQFGLAYTAPLKDSVLFVKTGMYYQQLDGRGQITYFNQINQAVLSYEKTQELYYLHVPILLQWNAINIRKLTVGFQGGLSYNYLLRAWHNPQRLGVDHNVSKAFNRNVLGFHGGAYITIPVNKLWAIQVQYLYGRNLSHVQKGEENSGFSTHALQLGLINHLFN
jgi:hypothetical protein